MKRIIVPIKQVPDMNRVTLFDIYAGDQVPPGKKSLAYRITFQSPTHTLTDEEVTRFNSQF